MARYLGDGVDAPAGLLGLEGVASAFAAARDAFDVVLRDRGTRRTTPADTTESLLRGAVASAVLEGSASSAESIRHGGGDPVAAASLRVSTELLGLAPRLGQAPMGVLARLHALAAADLPSAGGLGRPRGPADAATLQDLGLLLARGEGPALLVAAVAHAELATVEPFGGRDGLIARAVERLVLVARGADGRSLMVPEAGHLRLRAAYESNLRAWRAGDRGAWLRYAAEAYTAGAEASPLAGPAG